MWDERFSSPEYVYGTEPNDFLAGEASRIPPGRVLALADGEGRNGVHLAALGYDVTSVDSSAVGLAKAQRLAASRNVRITAIVADLAGFEIVPESWQGVVSVFCHLPPAVRRPMHERVVRGLAPGGVLLLESYSVRQLGRGTGGPTNAELLMTLEAARDELRGLDLLLAHEVERDIHEGALHAGPSAVVQVIARKPG